MTRIVIPLAFLARALFAQHDCSGCHPAQASQHRESHHAHAALPVQQTEFFRKLPAGPVAEARGGFMLSYSNEGMAVRVTARRGTEVASALIGWVLGAGDQGQTPIAMTDTAILEHRISYYSSRGRFDLTLGHSPGPSSSAAAALGVPQNSEVARACFGCHSTLAATGEVVTPGVQCERCHAGAAEHSRSGATGVANPAKMEAFAAVKICAQCHRLDAPGHKDDPLNIRFQPLRLVKSRCFQGGTLTCSVCHEAHRDAVRNDSAFYVAKCVGCHSTPHRPDNCLPCHMARSSPAPYLAFTDHYIRKKANGRR